jgi:hypothetical protein
MDPSFFNNHDTKQMRQELEYARTCTSSFLIQNWIDSSNVLLLKHFENIKFLSKTINKLLELEHRKDIISYYYKGGFAEYHQTLVDLLKSSDTMIERLYERYNILIEASIIIKHVKTVENMMAMEMNHHQKQRAMIDDILKQQEQIRISIL